VQGEPETRRGRRILEERPGRRRTGEGGASRRTVLQGGAGAPAAAGGGGRRSGRRWLRGRSGSRVRRLSSSSPALDGLFLPLFSGNGFHPPLCFDRKIAAGSESTVGTGAPKLASPDLDTLHRASMAIGHRHGRIRLQALDLATKLD
jgi:hypothetical protein